MHKAAELIEHLETITADLDVLEKVLEPGPLDMPGAEEDTALLPAKPSHHNVRYEGGELILKATMIIMIR